VFADANRFAFFNPVEHTSKVVPQLSNGSRLHVQQECYTFCKMSTLPSPAAFTRPARITTANGTPKANLSVTAISVTGHKGGILALLPSLVGAAGTQLRAIIS
jgi:hypothetical protein